MSLEDEVGRWEVFISYASEDKAYVQSLVKDLEAQGISVWYDESIVKWGDDFRAEIDKGLVGSDYVIVVLSPAYIGRKKWTEYEMTSVLQMETLNKKRILPIWHNVSRDAVEKYSSAVVGRHAKSSAIHSNQEIVADMLARLGRPVSREKARHVVLGGKTTPVSGDLTKEQLAATLTRREQLAFERVTTLTIDTTQVRNLVTTVSEPQQLGAIAIVDAGDASQGTKFLSTTAYISGNKTNVDLYRRS